MAKLIKAVFVKDPDRHRTVLLHPGEEPEPRLAAQVTNPEAWEDGKLPAAAKAAAKEQQADTESSTGEDDKQPAKRPAGKRPARGRNAADEGTSGE